MKSLAIREALRRSAVSVHRTGVREKPTHESDLSLELSPNIAKPYRHNGSVL